MRDLLPALASAQPLNNTIRNSTGLQISHISKFRSSS